MDPWIHGSAAGAAARAAAGAAAGAAASAAAVCTLSRTSRGARSLDLRNKDIQQQQKQQQLQQQPQQLQGHFDNFFEKVWPR